MMFCQVIVNGCKLINFFFFFFKSKIFFILARHSFFFLNLFQNFYLCKMLFFPSYFSTILEKRSKKFSSSLVS